MAIIGPTLECPGPWEGFRIIVGRKSAGEPTQCWEVAATALEGKPGDVTRNALGGRSRVSMKTATSKAASRLVDLRATIVSMQRRST